VPVETKEKHKTDSSVRIAGIQIESEGSASRMRFRYVITEQSSLVRENYIDKGLNKM
jgi:hypothetical protein